MEVEHDSPVPPVSLTPAPDASPAAVEAFLSLVSSHQRRLSAFIGSLVPNPTDADDIVQEANLVLWREFRRFEPGTNFFAWATAIAFNQVLAWRKRRDRDRLVFSDAFLTAIANELAESDDKLEERSRALARCVQQIPPHHRELIRLRYSDGQAVEVIAARLNRTPDAVYRMLSRIRQALFDCASRLLAGGRR